MPVQKAIELEHIQKSLGDRIRRLRNRLGWSQEQFAEVCGFHRTYMGHVERGEKNVSLSTVLKVANALGMRLPELFQLEKRETGTDRPAQANGERKEKERKIAIPGLKMCRILEELRAERTELRQLVRQLTRVLARQSSRANFG